MIDRVKFTETLQSIAEVAKIAEKPLTREDIISYFDDIELTEEQIQLVLAYLTNPGEDTKDEVPAAEETSEELEDEQEESKVEDFDQYAKNSRFLSMYLDEVKDLNLMTSAESHAKYMELLDGDETVMQEILDDWLPRVVELAKTYSTHQVNYEDLIQEGNMGLVRGMQHLLGLHERLDVEEYLKEAVMKAMEDYIDEMHEIEEKTQALLAKSNLIYEAQKALAEQNMEMPSILQLSEYTRIPMEEIEDILRLQK